MRSGMLDHMFARLMPGTHATFHTRRDYRDHAERCARYPMRSPTAQAGVILDALYRDAFYVVEGYWDRRKCARAVEEIDRLLGEYPRFVHGPPKSDFRIFGADRLSAACAEFGGDRMLEEVATLHNRMPTRLGMTLAAKLPAGPRNLGSGEGWHRDQFFVSTKAMLYLTDVGPENGPFQLVRESFELEDICRDILRAELGHMQYRIRNEQVDRLIAATPERLKTFAAPAGTLIVFNASTIHRGKPIAQGVRYALTNYYFTSEWSDAEIERHFAPVATAA